jgi:hypothetical protein
VKAVALSSTHAFSSLNRFITFSVAGQSSPTPHGLPSVTRAHSLHPADFHGHYARTGRGREVLGSWRLLYDRDDLRGDIRQQRLVTD